MFVKNRRILGAAAVNLISNFLGKGMNYFALSILVAYFLEPVGKRTATSWEVLSPFGS